MFRKSGSLHFVIPAFPALAFAFFADLCFQSRRFTILDHAYRPDPLRFILLAAAGFFLLSFLGIAVAKGEARRSGQDVRTAFFSEWPVFLPFLLLFLAPLLSARYLTREDLQGRLWILGTLVIGTTALMILSRFRATGRPGSSFPAALLSRFEKLPRKKKIVFLFLAAWLTYNLAVFVLVAQGITFSGDEPNYLITTDSLVSDRDINLANNYAEQDYFHFYSKKDNPRLRLGIYGRYGKKGPQEVYPINLPGISVLMIPFYSLSQLFSGKILTFLLKGSLSVWAALLGVQLYLYAADRWKSEKLSLSLWALYSFTAPILFYAIHLYPEVPLAFMSLLVFRKVSSGTYLKTVHLFGLGFLLSTFFWFGVKFNLIFWPLLAVAVYHLWTIHKIRGRIAAFLVFPVISTALFYVYVHALYGTFSPFSIYEGVMTAEQFRAWKSMIMAVPFRERIDAFLDYFLDQRDGLLLYAPFYAFAFLGFIEMFRKAKKDFFALMLVALPFVINYGFFTHRQGYSPQARVLAPVSWTAILAIGWFLSQNRKPAFAKAFRIAVCVGAAIAILLLIHPQFLYQPTTHEYTERAGDLFIYLGNMHIFLPGLLPSFIKIDNTGYMPNYIWLAGLLVFILLYAFGKTGKPLTRAGKTILIHAFLLLGFALWCLYPRTSLYPSVDLSESGRRPIGLHAFPMGKGVIIKPSGDMYLHAEKTYRILFSSRRELEKVKILYGSERGEYRIDARFFDLPLFEGRTSSQTKEYIFAPAAYYRFRNLFVYELDIRLEKLSEENMLLDPYRLAVIAGP